MSKVHCEVIEDLLPLYVEDMASPSSKNLVEEHLESCEACRQKKERMGQTVEFPADTDTKPLNGIRKKLFRRKATQLSVTALSLLLLAILCIVHLNSPIAIPYETISDSITGQRMDNGKTLLSMDDMGGDVSVEYGWDEDGVWTQYISIHTTRLRQLQQVPSERAFFTMDQTGVGMAADESAERLEQLLNDDTGENNFTVSIGTESVREVRRVYYYPRRDSGEAVMIYQDPDLDSHYHGGVSILPRLTLNYYTILAGAAAVLGALVCFVMRKNEKRFPLLVKLTLLPAAYVICSLLILWGKNPIYDVAYYLSGILMATLVLYVLGYWGWEYVRYRKQM